MFPADSSYFRSFSFEHCYRRRRNNPNEGGSPGKDMTLVLLERKQGIHAEQPLSEQQEYVLVDPRTSLTFLISSKSVHRSPSMSLVSHVLTLMSKLQDTRLALICSALRQESRLSRSLSVCSSRLSISCYRILEEDEHFLKRKAGCLR